MQRIWAARYLPLVIFVVSICCGGGVVEIGDSPIEILSEFLRLALLRRVNPDGGGKNHDVEERDDDEENR